MSIFLIRHGETIFNAARIVQLPETPLSERGFAQARQLGERMRATRLETILCSDYARAHSTAQAVQATTGAPLDVRPLLRERNLGDHRGTPFAELDVDIFAPDYHPPSGESWPMFHERVRRAWNEICDVAADTGGHFAVVSHALVCHAIIDDWATVPEAIRPPEIRFGNTAVTRIDGPPWEVSLLACTSHLDADQVTYPNQSPI